METTGDEPHTGGGAVPSHESAAWLRATIDLAPIGIAHLALDGRIILANDRLCAMLGYTCEQLLARTLQGVAHTDDIAGCMARTAQLAVGKASSYREEMRFVHANGSTLRCRVSVSAVPHGALIPTFLVAMVEEIPEEHAPEAEEKPGYPAKFLDITDEAVVAFDAEERITFWNRGAERAFGWTADEVRGKSAAEVLWPASTEHEKRDNAQRFEILGRGDTVTGVYTAKRKDGMPRTIAFTARAFFDANSMLAGYVAVHRNVTDPPQGEREARVHTEQAKQLREEMLAVVAHDLRSPLNTIALAAAMMKIVPPEDEPTRQFVQRSATSMERLVRDLLDVTRIEAGTFAVHHARVLVAPLLQEVCEQFAAAAREREITLVCDMTRGVRAMVGDRERLAQVVSNLIANAIKFTPPQGGVSVRAQVRDRHVQISVEDTGPDVHPASLPHVFDRFWPAERAASAGAGLGLQIAKGIVEAHGGCLWAENTLGRGTTFHFTIPARS